MGALPTPSSCCNLRCRHSRHSGIRQRANPCMASGPRPGRRAALPVLLAAGAAGAASAAFGKLAGQQSSAASRLACYVLLVCCNVAMASLYTRGLRSVPSLRATVTAVAANM